MDNALYINGMADRDQPGIHVRRIDGTERSTDGELLNHYQKLVQALGESVNGHWEFGVCVADPDEKVWETTVKSPRIFSCKKSKQIVPGYPLEFIQMEPYTGMYISEMSKD